MKIENTRVEVKTPHRGLRQLSRISAWALLVSVVFLVVSGWGITQTGAIYRLTFGLVDRRLANEIHRASVIPLALFFLLHVLLNIRLKFNVKNPAGRWVVDGLLIALGGLLMWLVVYMEYVRLGG